MFGADFLITGVPLAGTSSPLTVSADITPLGVEYPDSGSEGVATGVYLGPGPSGVGYSLWVEFAVVARGTLGVTMIRHQGDSWAVVKTMAVPEVVVGAAARYFLTIDPADGHINALVGATTVYDQVPPVAPGNLAFAGVSSYRNARYNALLDNSAVTSGGGGPVDPPPVEGPVWLITGAAVGHGWASGSVEYAVGQANETPTWAVEGVARGRARVVGLVTYVDDGRTLAIVGAVEAHGRVRATVNYRPGQIDPPIKARLLPRTTVTVQYAPLGAPDPAGDLIPWHN
jgi:hypothetical protein